MQEHIKLTYDGIKLTNLSIKRVRGITIFSKFITLWKGKELIGNNTNGWKQPTSKDLDELQNL